MVTWVLPPPGMVPLEGFTRIQSWPEGLGFTDGKIENDCVAVPLALKVMVCETELFAPPIWYSSDSEKLLTVIVASAVTVSVTPIDRGAPVAGVMVMFVL